MTAKLYCRICDSNRNGISRNKCFDHGDDNHPNNGSDHSEQCKVEGLPRR